MNQFSDGLYRLLLRFEVIKISDNEYAVAVFAVGCAIVGFVAVLGDLALFAIRGQSLLNLKHGWRNTPVLAIAWAGGAMVIGYLGQMTNIFQVSLLACATVGTAWPLVFTRILQKTTSPEEEQQSTSEEQA